VENTQKQEDVMALVGAGNGRRPRRGRRILRWTVVGIIAVALLAAGVSAYRNASSDAAPSYITESITRGTLRVTGLPGPDGHVRLEVADTGIGIAPDQLGKIFDPLFTTKARGIGLGLSVAHSLARANHSRLEVASEPGCGSRFCVRLPLLQGSTSELAVDDAGASARS